ncbi:DNA polymerase [EBPR siphovirus 2]|nr:DNA polymerase [EBPR siphovirus 2]
MTVEIRGDFETRGAVDLRTRGSAVYFECPHFRPLGLSYRIGNGGLNDWEFGQPCPSDLRTAIEAGAYFRAWNASFERGCLNWLADNCGWPRLAVDRFRCTASEASALGLPRSLDAVAVVLNLPMQKDKEGTRLIQFFSIPRRPRKDDRPGEVYFNEPEDHPEEYAKFVSYRRQDVLTEEAAAVNIIPLSDAEQAVYTLDQIINDRGIRIDRRTAVAAIALAEKTKAELDRRMRTLTKGAVGKCTEVGKLVEWIGGQGVAIGALAKADIIDLLHADDLPDLVREALELRQQAAKTSVSKLKTMLQRTSRDGRVRNAFLYHKASTGRWASVGVNLANLPRPRKEYEAAFLEPPKGSVASSTGFLFDVFRQGEPQLVELLYGSPLGRPLDLISDALRSFLIAGPGNEIIQADYTSIEGCVIAWTSDEKWKLKALEEIFADPSLPDLYRRTAANIMNSTTEIITKKHPYRQSVGKVSELACFGADTLVLTDNGTKRIADVQLSDRLWDGVEWVNHRGVIGRGVKSVVDVDGIAVTPDHLIMTGQKWREAQQLVSSAELLSQALATGSANLPSSPMNSDRQAALSTFVLAAHAAKNLARHLRICARATLRAAGTALSRSADRRGKPTWVTMTSYPTMSTVVDCSIEYRPVSTAAPIRKTEATQTTVGGESLCSGGVIAGNTLSIWSRFRDGTIRCWNSIASKLTGVTNLETFDLSRVRLTRETGGKCNPCNLNSTICDEKTPNFVSVYDIAFAGPRNRFVVFSTNGALLVHNCGFGGGVSAFYSMAKLYNVDLMELYAPAWANNTEEMREKAAKRYENNFRRNKAKARELPREAWMACWLVTQAWRASNPAIAKGWSTRENAIRDALRAPGHVIECMGRLRYIVSNGFLFAQLPSGRCLAYAGPKLRDQVWAKVKCDDGSFADAEVMDREQAEKLALLGRAQIQGDTTPSVSVLGLDKTGKKMRREPLFGALAAQNDTQSIARDILVNGMFKAEGAGYPIIGHVYDEMFAEVRRGTRNVKDFERLICEKPEWAAGLPLAADGFTAKRYRK